MEYNFTKEQFLAAKQAWKTIIQPTAEMHIIYNFIRSKPIKHGFSEKKKNIQGNDPWYAFNNALWSTKYYTNENFKTLFGFECDWKEIQKGMK
jgi:hypothetical protein